MCFFKYLPCWQLASIVLFTVTWKPRSSAELYQKKNLGTSSDFIAVSRLTQKCQFEIAKYKLAKICNINLRKEIYNFYGDEYSLFTKHLNVFLRHTLASECSSFFVQKRNCKKSLKVIPVLIAKASMTLLRKQSNG